jgi:hypothetical protein
MMAKELVDTSVRGNRTYLPVTVLQMLRGWETDEYVLERAHTEDTQTFVGFEVLERVHTEDIQTFGGFEVLERVHTEDIQTFVGFEVLERVHTEGIQTFVGFEVFKAVTMKSKNRRFGGMCRLHLHGRKIREREKC